MKNKLDEARMLINEIDDEMIKLFKKRLDAVKMVAEYKLENHKEIFDKSREDEIIERNIHLLNDDKLNKYYLTFFNGVLESSKEYQKDFIEKKEK